MRILTTVQPGSRKPESNTGYRRMIAGGIGEAVRIHQGDYRILRYLVLIQTRV